jgi:putative glycosyltransferase (TIGR04372 family)
MVARDNGYLSRRYPELDFSYHQYRNADIDSFREAALKLVDLGFFVIRIGQDVEKRFNCDHERVIDYPFSPIRSDFMDIFLSSECKFMISTQTGIDSVAHFMFRRPTLMVNVAPIGIVLSSRMGCMSIFKRYVEIESGRELGLMEIGERNLTMEVKTKSLSLSGVVLKDNTSKEICDAVDEMLLLMANPEQSNTSKLQMEFVQQLKIAMGDRFSEYHGEFRVRIGESFLIRSSLVG